MIKKLAKYVGKYKLDAILTPLFVAAESVLEVLIPFKMADLIDFGIEAENINYVVKIGVILLAFSIMSLICGTLSGYFASRASSGYAKNLREAMYNKIQDYSFSNVDKFSASSLVTRLTTDVTNVQNAFQMIIRIAVRAPIMFFTAMIMSFMVNRSLALVFVCVIPFLAVGLYFISTRAHPIFERVFRTYDKLNNVVQENIRGIRVVKSFVREDHEIEKFENVSNSIYKDFSKAERLLAFNSPLMQFCVYACIMLISWFGAKLVVSGSLSTGQIMSMFTYVMQILMSLMMISMILVMLVISKSSAERIVEVLDEENDIHNCADPMFEVTDGSVKFDNVNFSYSKDMNKLCLKDINLDIKSGETVGIIGGTGSSKSSLVQLIPRLYDVTEGTVYVGGVDVRNYDIETLRNNVAMVLQKNVLFSGTIKDNLRWGDKNATDEDITRVCKLAQADDFIQNFPDKYDTYIEQGGSNVSGGQRQRLCIARALLKKPKILILDDSTSAVDTKTDALLRKAFKEEIPDTTKFIIAQRISSIQDADKIIILDDGKIVAVGTHDELIETSDIYKDVYYSQQKPVVAG